MQAVSVVLLAAAWSSSLFTTDLELRVIITNQTNDQFLVTLINTSINKEESAQLMPAKGNIDMALPWGYYSITFRNVAHGKTISVDRSTLTNVSNTCVAVTLTSGSYSGEPNIGFSALCAPPAPQKR